MLLLNWAPEVSERPYQNVRPIEYALDHELLLGLADYKVCPILEPSEHVGASQEIGHKGPVVHEEADIFVFCHVEVCQGVDHIRLFSDCQQGYDNAIIHHAEDHIVHRHKENPRGPWVATQNASNITYK